MPAEIVGVLLAAGRSRRFGSDKRMHRLADGRTMVSAAAAHLRPACDRLVAVGRLGDLALKSALAEIDCEIITCPDADAGMGFSLAAGVRAAPDAAGWIVALADMPFIQSSSHLVVAEALRSGASLAATEFAGRRGHPVGFAQQWLSALDTPSGDQGGREILRTHSKHLVLCRVNDPGVLVDIDLPEDLPDRMSRHGD